MIDVARHAAPAGRQAADIGLYLHVPFCVRKCFYCDFNSYQVRRADVLAFLDAIKREIDIYAASALGPWRFDTIFVGGGTPSVLTGRQLGDLLQHVRGAFELSPDAEITTEANPNSVTPDRVACWREAGINRLSMGVQSFDDDLLGRLGRVHSAADVHAAYRTARAAGFDNINLDLMFALPGQTQALWLATLDQALALLPEHISAYSLIVEEGTPFFDWRQAGRLPLPDEDAELEMYEHAIRHFAAAGYEHYEISNFAQPGRRCRHNLVYWRYGDYLGLGPGAHSFWQGSRFANLRLPQAYNEAVDRGKRPLAECRAIDPGEQMDEAMMLGLRLLEGVDKGWFAARFGCSLDEVYGARLEGARRHALVEDDPLRVGLTRKGLPLANQVFAAVLR